MAMAHAQELPGAPVAIIPAIRRFEVPDMAGKGMWITRRLLESFPHLSERQLVGWLNGLIYSPEYLFLHQHHAVALAQLVSTTTLSERPVVQERFIFVEDKDDAEQVKAAAEFYSEFSRWGMSKNADVMLVNELTDIPEALIREKLGRMFPRTQTFCKLDGKKKADV